MTTYIPERKLKPAERLLLVLAVLLALPAAMFPPLLLGVALAALPVWLVVHLVRMARTSHAEVDDFPAAGRRLRLKVPRYEHHARIWNHWTVNHDRQVTRY